MKSCFPMSSDGSCFRRRCLRCWWNRITGQTRRRREALISRMDEFRARTDACDHEWPERGSTDRPFVGCLNRCGTIRPNPDRRPAAGGSGSAQTSRPMRLGEERSP